MVTKKYLIIGGIGIVLIISSLIIVMSINPAKGNKPKVQPKALEQTTSVFGKFNEEKTNTPTSKSTAKGYVFKLDQLKFTYPDTWPDASHIKTYESSLGKGAELINENALVRIIVLSGINTDTSLTDLNDFLSDIAGTKGKYFLVEGNNGAAGEISIIPGNTDPNAGSKNIALYINTPDKQSQYAIYIETPTSVEDKVLIAIRDQIIQTASFK